MSFFKCRKDHSFYIFLGEGDWHASVEGARTRQGREGWSPQVAVSNDKQANALIFPTIYSLHSSRFCFLLAKQKKCEASGIRERAWGENEFLVEGGSLFIV